MTVHSMHNLTTCHNFAHKSRNLSWSSAHDCFEAAKSFHPPFSRRFAKLNICCSHLHAWKRRFRTPFEQALGSVLRTYWKLLATSWEVEHRYWKRLKSYGLEIWVVKVLQPTQSCFKTRMERLCWAHVVLNNDHFTKNIHQKRMQKWMLAPCLKFRLMLFGMQ